VVQLMVDDAESVTRYPIPAQLALMDHFRKLGATTMWFSHGRDGYRMVVMPSAAQAAANAAAAEIARQLMEQQQ
jgi:2-methylisocitrate lyase-like PEP mutase family enzyme